MKPRDHLDRAREDPTPGQTALAIAEELRTLNLLIAGRVLLEANAGEEACKRLGLTWT